MYSSEDLEALSFRELQKLAKNRKIRQSGKGITKKVLVSVLLDSVSEFPNESRDSMPLKELEVKLLHPVSSPEQSSFEERSFLDVERELNESNKENSGRRLTYEIIEQKPENPPVAEEQIKNASGIDQGKSNPPKNRKRVRIHENPKEKSSNTPKPTIKIVKTPVPNRKSSGRHGALLHSKTPSTVQEIDHTNVTLITGASSVKKTVASQSKTPLAVQKTPRMNKAVALRLASSVKKTIEKNRSKIPKLDVKKAPNFANIHQNAFDKMDSLWDVEHQRVLRKRNAQSNGSLFTFSGKTGPPKKINTNFCTNKKTALDSRLEQHTGNAVFKFGANKEPATEKSVPINKFNSKDAASKAVNKLNASRGTAIKEEQRSFLKGVRLNRRFQMQMQNRGLIS